ncbi:TackOD1 domain-containing metal-binding protein [Bradyrhizobium sp. USDA 4011]
MPPGCVESDDGVPDIIVLTETNAAALVSSRLRPALAAVLPIVDVSGRIGQRSQFRRADIVLGGSGCNSLADAAQMLNPVIQRVHGLPPPIFAATDPRVILLARLLVRERGMEPRRDPSVKETVSYDDEIAVPGARMLAEQLVGLGLMERRFFDMRSVCPYCDSARLSVRERCISCGSADVADHAILHHMRCGFQGPEQDFFDPSKEDVLRCPKCTRRLEEFSIDYDRPGTVCVCRACGRVSGDTAVEFGCLDCDADIASANIDSRSVYAYFLTEAGPRLCDIRFSRHSGSTRTTTGDGRDVHSKFPRPPGKPCAPVVHFVRALA